MLNLDQTGKVLAKYLPLCDDASTDFQGGMRCTNRFPRGMRCTE